MGYGRLDPSNSGGKPQLDQPDSTMLDSGSRPPPATSKTRFILLSFITFTLIVASAISTCLILGIKPRDYLNVSPSLPHATTHTIVNACSKTRYRMLCENSLLKFPDSLAANEQDLIHISFNVTLQHFNKALYYSSGFSTLPMDPRVRSAYDDCMELLEDSIDALSRSLVTVAPSAGGKSKQPGGSTDDVVTWLSASLTNHETCTDGFEGVKGPVKDQMTARLKDLSELVSNCLAIFTAGDSDDFSGIPIHNKRRLLADNKSDTLPNWLGRKERRLLDAPVNTIKADIVVSKDGNGTCKTILEAIKKAPEYSSRRIVIYVKAGRYEEDNLKVGRKKTNLMFVGDGKGKTIISGGKSITDSMTTFHTASFAATGAGFIAKDITFENWAGPSKHQAVALRVGADHAVVYRCSIIGYQDTLYVHSNRQFFRECDIYGTVDFIFGNAAVVIQNCSIYARKPMPFQKNTITAQNRKDPNQNTGISIHACRILPTGDLQASNGNFLTYLGRPWKLYSRVVVMQSNIGAHIHPSGWLEWNATFALDTLYYGEYMNYGPGGAIGRRVKWPGYRVITSPVEAGRFTVSQFIYGSSWLPSTGVAFLGGFLSV